LQSLGGKEAITESQFSNFVSNIKISDPQKKDRSFKEFRTKNRIGKILSSKEELETPQHPEPVIEIQSTPFSQFFEHSNQSEVKISSIPVPSSNQTVIEIRSTPASQIFDFSNMILPQSSQEVQPIFQEIETPRSQLTQGRLIVTSVTSELFFAPPNQNFNPLQRRDSNQQEEIRVDSNQSFQDKQLTATKSKKCCIIL
jgi:hypothetical protein